MSEMMEGNFCSTSTLQQLLHLSFLEFSKCKCPQKTFESWRSTKQFADRIESLVGLCLLGKIGQESKCNQFLATYLYFPCRLEVVVRDLVNHIVTSCSDSFFLLNINMTMSRRIFISKESNEIRV